MLKTKGNCTFLTMHQKIIIWEINFSLQNLRNSKYISSFPGAVPSLDAKTDFHTYVKIENRIRKMVMKAVPYMAINDIVTALEDLNIKVMEYVTFWGRFSNRRSYLLSFPNNIQISEIYKITKINNVMDLMS